MFQYKNTNSSLVAAEAKFSTPEGSLTLPIPGIFYGGILIIVYEVPSHEGSNSIAIGLVNSAV